MALTPNSNATAYATPTDLFNRYDPRVIGDLVGDQGARIGGSPNPALSTLAANTTVTTALSEASGILEAACLRGQRYSTTDLAVANGNSQAFLVGIVCSLAMGKLFFHKNKRYPVDEDWKGAQEILKALATGEAIFAFLETEKAGLLVDDKETPTDVDNRYLTTRQAEGLYGRRNNRAYPYPYPGYPGCGYPNW